MTDLSRWAPSLTAFAKWLQVESPTTAKSWSRRLGSNQAEHVESAIAEAVVWDFVACRCDTSWLNDAPGTGGSDFGFTAHGRTFLVEATNILSRAAAAESGMPDTEVFSGFHGLLTDRVRQKVRGKLEQARQQSEHPLLVAVTTLHWNASVSCVNRMAVEFAMGSPPQITSELNTRTGEAVGDPYQSTDLSRSVFLSPNLVLGPDGRAIAQAKYQPISGFLVGGFGLRPNEVRVLGALNPVASRPFDTTALPDIPWCSFHKWPVTDHIEFDWTISEEVERQQERQAAERRLRDGGHGELLDDIRRELRRRNE